MDQNDTRIIIAIVVCGTIIAICLTFLNIVGKAIDSSKEVTKACYAAHANNCEIYLKNSRL